MRWGPYQLLKTSGVDWLGAVPAHWVANRLRFALAMNPSSREASHLAPDDEVSFVPMEAVGERGGLELVATRPAADFAGTYTYFRDDDVVVAKITPCFENGKGAHAEGLVNGAAIGTTELHVLRPHSEALDARFLFYLSISQPFRALGEASMYGAGGQKRVPDTFIKDFRAPLPPLDEQRAIAAFLDRETARIDALVAAKRRLIALLQEKRTALIARAVTRGLDPDVPTKDSGVAWLGRVPAHWDVVPLTKYLESIVDYRGATPTKTEDGVFLVTTTNIRGGRIDYDASHEYIDPEAYDEVMRRGKPEVGDVLFTMEAPLGETANIDRDDVALAQRIVKFRPKAERLNPYFLKYWIMGSYFQKDVLSYATGSTAQGIKASKLGYLKCVLPPLDEQTQIVEHLNSGLSNCDATERGIDAAIDRLTEYRSTLITAAITGRIDVRAAA
jgi:type I restriction enzyme, S subunit